MNDRRGEVTVAGAARVAAQGLTWVCVFAVANATVLAVLVTAAASGGMSSAFMWVRGCVLLAVVPLLLVLVRGVAHGSRSAMRRLWVVTTVMPVAIVAVDLVPGLCPWWYTALQGIGAVALIPVAVVVRRFVRDVGAEGLASAAPEGGRVAELRAGPPSSETPQVRAIRDRFRRGALAIAGGVVRCAAFAGAAAVIPAACALLPVLAALGLVGSPWSWANPWSWLGLVVIVIPVTLSLAHPVALVFRGMLLRWESLPLTSGYRVMPAPVRLSTGFWWNGASYERSREDALRDLRSRRLREPAYRREVRWAVVAAVTVLPCCGFPPAALTLAAGFIVRGGMVELVLAAVAVALALASAPFLWRAVRPLAIRVLAAPAATGAAGSDVLFPRADLASAHDAEIRRIERDLHDGAQSRLTAVGMDLAAAERLLDTDEGRDSTRVRELLRSARAGTSRSVAELRDLVHGVYPPVLVERGLVPAIRALALDSAIRVSVAAPADPPRSPSPVEAAVYFAVAELLANAARHSGATRADVEIRFSEDVIVVAVTDDGSGGAAPRPGGGLDGVRRRLAAFEGDVLIDSPPGGPTIVTATVPCA